MKKDQPKVFYIEVRNIDKVFLYQVYLLNYQNRFYIRWRFVFMCVACNGVKDKEIEIWSWIAAVNHFQNWKFLQTFQKLPQNVQQK